MVVSTAGSLFGHTVYKDNIDTSFQKSVPFALGKAQVEVLFNSVQHVLAFPGGHSQIVVQVDVRAGFFERGMGL